MLFNLKQNKNRIGMFLSQEKLSLLIKREKYSANQMGTLIGTLFNKDGKTSERLKSHWLPNFIQMLFMKKPKLFLNKIKGDFLTL